MPILITGANGQVGQCFQQLAAQHSPGKFLFTDAASLDITDKKAVQRFFKDHKNISWCVNCAAYTAVDKAESEPKKARQVNVDGARNLALACAAQGIVLIQLSTDYVYHNRQNTPFREGDPTSPKSVYARTKLNGERSALRANPLTMVIRTSWVYSAFGANFVKTMLRLGNERPALRIVFDQIGTPTYAPDLAETILHIIEQVEKETIAKADVAGIWHYSNEGVTSWYDFAQAIFNLQRIPCAVYPIHTSEYPTPATRPPFSVLDKAKIKAVFGLEIPHWRTSLERCLMELEKQA